jgi:hypothetical protein
MSEVHKLSSDIHRNQNHRECYVCIVLFRSGTRDILVFVTYSNKQNTKTIKIVYVESKCIKSTTAVLVIPFL